MVHASNIAVRDRVRGYRNEDEATATETLEPGAARRSRRTIWFLIDVLKFFGSALFVEAPVSAAADACAI